ncbi:hypothetical protein ACI2IX_20110 [Leifsonia aquatica]|uniref:hypothetical protein n=1 Tax=Leifsonia aquatica TaxID=144185 RepID=UPI00384EA59D
MSSNTEITSKHPGAVVVIDDVCWLPTMSENSTLRRSEGHRIHEAGRSGIVAVQMPRDFICPQDLEQRFSYEGAI